MSEVVEVCTINFTKLKETSSDVLFHLSNSPIHKDIQFILTEDCDNQNTFTFKKLELVNFSS